MFRFPLSAYYLYPGAKWHISVLALKTAETLCPAWIWDRAHNLGVCSFTHGNLPRLLLFQRVVSERLSPSRESILTFKSNR